jgi:membrane protease YdiL (CAAX protease family)
LVAALALVGACMVALLVPGMRESAPAARAETTLLQARIATRLVYFCISNEAEGEAGRSRLLSALGFAEVPVSEALAEAGASAYESLLGEAFTPSEAAVSAAILYGYAGQDQRAASLLGKVRGIPPIVREVYSGRVLDKQWHPGADVMRLVNKVPAGPLFLAKVYRSMGEPARALRAVERGYARSLLVLVPMIVIVLAGVVGLLIVVAVLFLRPWRKPGRLQVPSFRLWQGVELMLLWVVAGVGLPLLLSPLLQRAGVEGIWLVGVLYAVPAVLAMAWFAMASLPAGERRPGSVGWRSRRGILAGIAGYCAIQPLVLIVWAILRRVNIDPTQASPVLPIIAGATSAGQRAAALCLVALLVPAFEETLFRGILYGALRRSMRPLFAALISAVVFGLFHFQLTAVPVLAVLGLVFAYVYERTGSLVAPVISHGLVNVMTTAVVMAVQ